MKLAELNECTGCQACFAVCPRGCIRMERDAEGFLYPVVDEDKCVNCGLCEASCPVLHLPEREDEKTLAYAAYSLNDELRRDSSSGGVFSEIAEEILAQHGAVFGAAYDPDFKIVHMCAESREDLSKLRGAKYAQSDLGDTFSDAKARLERGQPVLFTGTPCQVAGLKSYLRKEYDNLICVDFVCHGVPSPAAWQQYVKYQAQTDGKPVAAASVNMRAKTSGWSRYSYSHQFEYADGTLTTVSSGDSLFMKLFVGNYLSRQSCGNCHFKGYQRVSDITLGDFWGIWDISPDMDDNKGTSVVLCHSVQGARILHSVSSRLKIKPVTLEEASRQNPSMLNSSPAHPRREEALKNISACYFGACSAWFSVSKRMMRYKIHRLIHRFFS